MLPWRKKNVRRLLRPSGHGRAFTLVELLVVLGIIALLISILMPALAKARQSANSVKCKSNMRQVGIELQRYANESRGWLFPIGDVVNPLSGSRLTYGTNEPPDKRWPVYVWKLPLYPVPPYPTYGGSGPDAMLPEFDATAYTPPFLLCPSDFQPGAQHSYVLNEHMGDHAVRGNSTNFGGRSSQEVVLMGEKVTDVPDYYMEAGDFNRVVEKFRHGIQLGSNYLYLDGHVDTVSPAQASTLLLDPWDVLGGTAPSTTQGN